MLPTPPHSRTPSFDKCESFYKGLTVISNPVNGKRKVVSILCCDLKPAGTNGKRRQSKCTHCGTTQSAQWRNIPNYRNVKARTLCICNSCGIFFRKIEKTFDRDHSLKYFQFQLAQNYIGDNDFTKVCKYFAANAIVK